jgi:hypothetical protein
MPSDGSRIARDLPARTGAGPRTGSSQRALVMASLLRCPRDAARPAPTRR